MNSEITNIRRIHSERIAPGAAKGFKKTKDLEAPYPIGVFDSGVGGLTVLSQLAKQLPFEDVIYLADTARVPYGGRSPQEIIEINTEILDYFTDYGVKMVIMACGTSSSIAYPVLKDEYQFPIVSLVQPGAAAAAAISRLMRIGLIATAATVQSQAYQKTLHGLNDKIQVFAESCPLFVPLIEGGFIEADETKRVAKEYLKPLLQAQIDTLILGCTHYPHLIKILRDIAGTGVVFVDPAEQAIAEAKEILTRNAVLNDRKRAGEYSYLVTGSVPQFEELGSRLFSRPISGAKHLKF